MYRQVHCKRSKTVSFPLLRLIFPLLELSKIYFTVKTKIVQMQIENDGKAITIKKTFSRTTAIKKYIDAKPETVWNILINGSNYVNWNSTITMFEGEIKNGGKIKLKSYLDDKRVFKLKVKEMITNKKLVWGDGMGERTYLLERSGKGTIFSMTEKIGGPIFPLFAKMIPPFDESFEKFAHDLSTESEK